MKRLFFILAFVVYFGVTLVAQTYTQTNDMGNSYYGITGTETITLLKTDTFDIKNGIYRTKVVGQQKHGSYTITIDGEFSNNQPHGRWIYKKVFNNYNWNGSNRYYESSIILTQYWNNGKPEGNWIYDYKSKYRLGTVRLGGNIEYTQYMDIKSDYRSVNYLNGWPHGEMFVATTKDTEPIFRATFNNGYITYLYYTGIKHEFKLGNMGYATSVVEQFEQPWETDYYMKYSDEDMEIINKLNSGASPDDLGIDVYQDIRTYEVGIPEEFFASDFSSNVYGYTNNIEFSFRQARVELPRYSIYKYNTNKVYAE